MKRKSSTRGGGGGGGGGEGDDDEKWEGGTNKKHNSSSRSNNGYQTSKKTNLPPPPVIGTVATRTRRQKRELASKWNQPISILIQIMGYADPDTIRMLCCVSKQFHDLITNNPGMEYNRVVPLLEISPAEDQEDEGRIGRLLRFLYHHRDKLQLYKEIKIIDVQKFGGSLLSEWMELLKIVDKLRLYGIASLDIYNMSSLPPSTTMEENDLCNCFSSILPNLRDVNLSNNGLSPESLYEFSKKCPNLEKLTWHNIDRNQSTICIDGWDMEYAANLKEIYMDDSVFSLNPDDKPDEYSDLENYEHSNIFLFYQCRTKLERVSIRNAKWYFFGVRDYIVVYKTTVIPQSALIKFVRKAPASLRWFRSHLTKENMMMLRSERPGIELVN